jgi:hypothetical protein
MTTKEFKKLSMMTTNELKEHFKEIKILRDGFYAQKVSKKAI